MTHKLLKFAPVAAWLLPTLALAQGENPEDFLADIGETAGYVERSPAVAVGGIINAFLSVLGVFLIALLVYGGYLWMTARGEAERVKKAQETIRNAVIGLAIVLLAYSISWFVVRALISASFGVRSAAP